MPHSRSSQVPNTTPDNSPVKPVEDESRFYLKAAFFIISICILFEIFIFNGRHFITHWGDGQIDMDNTEWYPVNMLTNDHYGLVPTGEGTPEIVFPNINKRVVTVYIDPVFSDDENARVQSFHINYGSEEHSNRTTVAFKVIKGVEESKYVTLYPSGKVSHISLIYGGQYVTAGVRGVTLNKPVPLKIFWPRVLLFSIAPFCIVAIKRKRLFSLPLKSDLAWQNKMTTGIMAAFIAFLFMLMLFTLPFSSKRPLKENFANEPKDQYNAYVVDAILDGRTNLNIEGSEKFLAQDNLYEIWDPVFGDHVYYNGKLYSYFGIVQVLVLALPYKIITGRYIPTRVAIFIFSSLAGIFLMLIWRRLAFRYMKNMTLGIYALGQFTVAMCSMLSFLLIRPYAYEAAISSALFFTALGFWLILGNSTAKKNRWVEIAVGSLCMALAVGCRPTYLFFFPLIPVVLYKELKELWNDKKRFLGLCTCVGVPYTFVGCGLMWYNYIRFGSVFDFGMAYMLSSFNGNASRPNPIATLIKFIIGFFSFLRPSFGVSASFPFLYLSSIESRLAYKSYFYNSAALGLLALPVTWFVFGIGIVKKIIGKERKQIFHFITAIILIGILQLLMTTFISGVVINRYTVDFFWVFVLSSLFCAYFIYEGMAKYQEQITQAQGHVSLNLPEITAKIIYITMIISILLVFLLTLSGDGEGYAMFLNNNPAALFTLQRLLGFNTW